MTDEQFYKKIKIYRGIIAILIGSLIGAVGYSYSLRLDIDRLRDKVESNYDVIVNSYIRNIHNSLWINKIDFDKLNLGFDQGDQKNNNQ